MRLPRQTLLFFPLLLTTTHACVQFGANIDFSNYPYATINTTLVDNKDGECSLEGYTFHQEEVSFVWLDCASGFSATFSWINPNPVSYLNPWFEGTFDTNANWDARAGKWIYTAEVYGC
jgi:hypothetical protein